MPRKPKTQVLQEHLQTNPEVKKIAERIRKMRSPKEWLAIQQDLAYLTLKGIIPEDITKTILYLHQSWQQAFKVAQDQQDAADSQKDEIFTSVIVKGGPLKSQLKRVRGEAPELYDILEHKKSRAANE